MALDDNVAALYMLAEPDKVGKRLYRLRTGLGMSQAAMARLIAIKANALSQMEGGLARPSLDAALKMKAAFGVSLDWIYVGQVSGNEKRADEAIAEGMEITDARRSGRKKKPIEYAIKRIAKSHKK